MLDARYGDDPKARPDTPATPKSAPPAGRARPAPVQGAIATVWIEAAGRAAAGDKVPLTFGQVFAPGAVERGARLAGRLADGDSVPLQVDVKASHPDGSLRHAVISSIVPAPGAKPVALGLVRGDKAPAADASPATPAALLRAGLTASVKTMVEGRPYGAALDRLLAGAKPQAWLAGPVAHEWLLSTPLLGPGGEAHPHLAARFAVRWFPSLGRARVDLTVENNWAFEPAPRNIVYDVQVEVGGKPVYAREALEHYHHARWRKTFWWGGEADVHVRHDPGYLIGTRALPNFDRGVQVDGRTLDKMVAAWKGPKTEPMGVGQAMRAMPTTGGRPDIGLLPGWAAMYLLGMDRRAGEITFATADLAGSWSMHYRDRRSGLPVSLIDYPYMTLMGSPKDTRNPATGKSEAFPECARPEACKTPNRQDVSHQPNFAYLPYLLAGDHYYLEELQFWAMYSVFNSNPAYREHAKGLLKPEQVRGQAWGLRTLAEAAYITPDGHPLKKDLLRILDSNLDWYNAEYPRNPQANSLHVIVNGYAATYQRKTALAPWMDDFFTSAIGHIAELGFTKARPLLAWKAKFPVLRMTGEGSCWITAAMYNLTVRDSANSPYYRTIREAFRASHAPEIKDVECGGGAMASALKLKPDEMTGYSSEETGFPSNMQPALAYAADVLGEAGRRAWRKFMARSVKPDYGTGPQFAIVPRADPEN
ncbi:hypothetical protein [Massilia sp. DD77]|uniref:RIFT barrel domain-containing protein n=1 Tax=Massilia sp. DD77 TaxID=3109349 RepID=UPI002FFEDC18